MKQFSKLVFAELKLILREPEAVGSIFILPLFFLFLVMEIFIPLGDVPQEIAINNVVPSLIVLTIASTAIYSIPISIASYREIKFFKRLKATPVTPSVILGGIGIANVIITILGILLLIIGGKLVYQAEFGGGILASLVGFMLIFLSFISLFLIIAGICRTSRSASAISMLIYIPMMFFSGVFVPLEMLPDWIASYITPFIPATYAVELLQGLWLGNPLFDYSKEIILLFGFLILGLIISAKTFRWE